MKRFVLLAIIISVLSIIIGYFYIQGIWFTFDFLGMEKGSEGQTVLVWSQSSIGLGIFMLLLVGLKLFHTHKNIVQFMKLNMLIMFALHLPPFAFWFMFGLLTPIEGMKGSITHMVVLVLLVLTFREMGKQTIDVDSLGEKIKG